ncbi:hypothetical protein PFISCL1PPCAC_11317, partial [Pristionchus fissidentatus]
PPCTLTHRSDALEHGSSFASHSFTSWQVYPSPAYPFWQKHILSEWTQKACRSQMFSDLVQSVVGRQLFPSPTHPSSHVQLNPPAKLVHSARRSQAWSRL